MACGDVWNAGSAAEEKTGGKNMQGLVEDEVLGLGGRRRAASAVGGLGRVHGTGAAGTGSAAGWRRPSGELEGGGVGRSLGHLVAAGGGGNVAVGISS